MLETAFDSFPVILPRRGIATQGKDITAT